MSRLGELETVTGYTKLFVAEDMQAVIAAIDAESVLASRDETTTLVAMLISSYPHARGQIPSQDWTQFLLRLQEAFAVFPAIVGFEAITTATGLPKQHKFVPNPHEVGVFCEAIKLRLATARIMAQRHLTEAKRRSEENKWVPPTPEAKARVAAMVAKMHGYLEKSA